LEKSGESVATFAAKRGLSGPTLYTWCHEARGNSKGERRARVPSAKGRSEVATRPVYNGDQRRQAVEAYGKSGMTLKTFAQVYGISDRVLSTWVARYERGGPKALESHLRGRKKGSGGVLARLPDATKRAITAVKSKFPDFGLKKIRDFLFRFHAVKVSPGGVKKALVEAGLAPSLAVTKRRPKKRIVGRRFERATPNELWQSDITSFVLTRHHQRVYLVVFMDDCSRYVVSFALHTHQKANMVHECLLDGIARFGKPKEVLTDQGPQYFAWRGKSAFQKLLIREGIEHAKARTHHPQTVGKCERFWETVNAEFWDRCHPQDLVEARERLNHFIAHYNHFRPHQGLHGVTPADRFFGAESALRKTIEKKLAKNEIQFALGDKPRKSIYLFGQVDGEQVSLHGEGGRIVIETPEGQRRELALEDLGVGQPKGKAAKEQKDDEHTDDDDGAGACARGAGGGGCGGDAAEAAHAEVPQADEVPARSEDGVPGEGAVGCGERRGAKAGAPSVHGALGALAWKGNEGGGDGAAATAGAAAVADVAAGPVGYGGGAVAAAEMAVAEGGNVDARPAERCGDAPPAERGAREGAFGGEGSACASARASREPGAGRCEPDSNEGGSGGEGDDGSRASEPLSERACRGDDENGAADDTPSPCEDGSGQRCGAGKSRGVADRSSPESSA